MKHLYSSIVPLSFKRNENKYVLFFCVFLILQVIYYFIYAKYNLYFNLPLERIASFIIYFWNNSFAT